MQAEMQQAQQAQAQQMQALTEQAGQLAGAPMLDPSKNAGLDAATQPPAPPEEPPTE